MKAYYYGDPNLGLIGLVAKFAFRNNWFVWSAIIIIVFMRIVFVPPIWVLVMIGELGHTFASGIGLDSREW